MGSHSLEAGGLKSFKSEGTGNYFARLSGSRNGILLILCALFCKASNIHVERLRYDVGSDAGWRGTIWTHERYVDHVKSSGQAVPAFFRGGHYGIRLENVGGCASRDGFGIDCSDYW